jgi:hypothetical protein
MRNSVTPPVTRTSTTPLPQRHIRKEAIGLRKKATQTTSANTNKTKGDSKVEAEAANEKVSNAITDLALSLERQIRDFDRDFNETCDKEVEAFNSPSARHSPRRTRQPNSPAGKTETTTEIRTLNSLVFADADAPSSSQASTSGLKK